MTVRVVLKNVNKSEKSYKKQNIKTNMSTLLITKNEFGIVEVSKENIKKGGNRKCLMSKK